MKRAILTSPLQAITDRAHSHRSGEAVMYARMLEEAGWSVTVDYGLRIAKAGDYSAYDHVFVHPGNDWGGGLNLYGGLAAEAPAGLAALAKWEGPITSIPMEMPNYSFLISERLRKTAPDKVHPSWNDIDLTALADVEARAGHLRYPVMHDTFVLGDSHAISLYRPGVTLRSVPYQTLYGALKLGLESFLPEGRENLKTVELYFGNIDIRHHLCRQENPEGAAVLLAQNYVKASSDLLAGRVCDEIRLYEPLPIENPSRKIPKSGYYKGKPFWGSWEERNRIRNRFIEALGNFLNYRDERAITLVLWTDYLKNEAGELDFAHMERPQSVHLARASWPYWQGPKTSGSGLEAFL